MSIQYNLMEKWRYYSCNNMGVRNAILYWLRVAEPKQFWYNDW